MKNRYYVGYGTLYVDDSPVYSNVELSVLDGSELSLEFLPDSRYFVEKTESGVGALKTLPDTGQHLIKFVEEEGKDYFFKTEGFSKINPINGSIAIIRQENDIILSLEYKKDVGYSYKVTMRSYTFFHKLIDYD